MSEQLMLLLEIYFLLEFELVLSVLLFALLQLLPHHCYALVNLQCHTVEPPQCANDPVLLFPKVLLRISEPLERLDLLLLLHPH